MGVSNRKPIRVLHAAYSLGIGGIETWLINLLRELDRQKRKDIRFDFYLSEPGGCYEDEARSYGCRLFYAPQMNKAQKALELAGLYHRFRSLKKLLQREHYDVFHTHSVYSGGLQSKIALKVGVPVRIVHVHCSKYNEGGQASNQLKEKIRYYRFIHQNIPDILRYSTAITPCSSDAALFLLGNDWSQMTKCHIVFCGLSLDAFRAEITDEHIKEIRTQHGLPLDAKVIGHAGRMGSIVKNHFFLIDVFAELYRRDERYWLFLAGDGHLKPEIAAYARKLGVDERVVIPGNCPVSSLMTCCFDVHALPSLHEGLPVVGMEAVAGGLYTVCSDVITKDYTDVFADRVKTVSLDAPVSDWADAIEDGITRKISVSEGRKLLSQSPFFISASLKSLEEIYRGKLPFSD